MSTGPLNIARPQLALRVGVTGTRKLTSAESGHVRTHVEEALGHLRQLVIAFTSHANGGAGYEMTNPPVFRAISPLAAGADCLFAESALAHGFQLEVPLPFAQNIYEMDFPDSIEHFRSLLRQAAQNVLVLDGGCKDSIERDASYEAVGRFVVRNSDVIVAIWDGGHAKGRGGTAEIVQYAAENGVPVLWFLADGTGEPCWIDNPNHLRHFEDCPRGEAAFNKLRAYLEALLLSSSSEPAEDTTSFFEGPGSAKWQPIWGTYGVMMKMLTFGLRRPPSAKDRTAPANDVWRYWDRFYRSADTLAVQCAMRYRSSFVLVVLLAAITTLAAVTGMSVNHWARQAAILELIFLAMIGYIVWLNFKYRWHKHMISYRLLAELIRDQQMLGMLGWSLPLARPCARRSETARHPLLAWYFNAIVRAAPMPRGNLAGTALVTAHDFVLHDLIAGQLSYHKSRGAASQFASERLATGSKIFFGLTLIFVLAKCIVLFTSFDEYAVVLDFITVALPAISVALASIRSYAELEILVDQSASMEQLLTQSQENLTHATRDLDEPLASVRLGHEILRLAQAMQLDTDGWAQLFRIKPVEAGG